MAPVTPVSAPGAASAVSPEIRAANLTRSLFHVASGLGALSLVRLLPGRGWLVAVSAAFAVSGWTMEIARRRSRAVNDLLMRLFAPVAHPHERHRVNSSTWYCTALLALSLLAPLRSAEIGVLVLALADPAAGLIGRRFGRTRLRGARSLEGSLGFLAVGTLVAATWLILGSGLAVRPALFIAAVAATVGALVELFSTRLDDNLTIPLSVTAAAAAAELLLR